MTRRWNCKQQELKPNEETNLFTVDRRMILDAHHYCAANMSLNREKTQGLHLCVLELFWQKSSSRMINSVAAIDEILPPDGRGHCDSSSDKNWSLKEEEDRWK